MTINVYLSVARGAPFETHEWAGTLGAFLDGVGADYKSAKSPRLSICVNGEEVPYSEWGSKEVCTRDDVQITILQHGGVLSGIGSILGKVFNTLFGWLMPSQAGQGGRNDPGQGKQLDPNNTTANQPKLNDVVPEIAGRVRRYPDYLTPPRRYFTNRREQWLEFMACIGVGKYSIPPETVKVGNTPFAELGDDAEYVLFNPGEDVSAHEAHNHWHTVDEVGGTSSGTAGLELPTELVNRDNVDPSSYQFAGNVISRSDGVFPSGWGAGTVISIDVPMEYYVTRMPPVGPNDTRINRITGNFKHCLYFSAFPDQVIRLNGTEYLVFDSSISPSTGEGWIELYTVGDGVNPPEPVEDLALGTQIYTFRTDNNYDIVQMTETSITIHARDRPTWIGFADGSWPGTIRYVGGRVYGEWTNGYVGCPGKETTDVIEFDIFFQNGLGRMTDSQRVDPITVEVEFEYWDSENPGVKTTVSRAYTDATIDQIGFTERITIPRMNPTSRMRRVGAESTSSQVIDKCYWYGYKTKLHTRTSYPDWSTMIARLRSGGRLAAQSENQINVEATRVLPVMQEDGTFGAEAPTRDISAIFRYQALSTGYTDNDIDMVELKRLHDIWSARGDYFDYIYTSTTAQQAMNLCLGAGFAELSVSDGLLRPVRDEPRTQYEQPYGPFNMTTPLRRVFRSKKHDDFDGVEVEYMNAETWTTETIRCLLPGDVGLKLERIKAEGVTDKTRAWRIGMRRRREIKYRIWEHRFNCDMSALNSDYMSYVPLFDDVPGWGKASILMGISPATGGAVQMRLSEPVDWSAPGDKVIAYRSLDGKFIGPFPATRGMSDYHVIANIPSPIPAVSLKAEPINVYCGPVERFEYPSLITSISIDTSGKASVSGVNYDGRVYDDDNNSPE